MANELIEKIDNAGIDAVALSDFMIKDAGVKVPRRLAPAIDTLEFYLDYLRGLQAVYEQESGVVDVNGVKVKPVKQALTDALNAAVVGGGGLADTAVAVTAKYGSSVARTQANVNAERISVKDFGAIGDGTPHTVSEWIPSRFPNLAAIKVAYPKVTALTDYIDRVAIQACIDVCTNTSKIAYGVSGDTYCIDKQVDILSNADFSGCKFLVANTYSSKVISTSARTINKLLLRNLTIVYPEVTNTSAPGDNHYGATGIYLEGVRNCTMTFSDIYGMETNLHLYSSESASYISYNSYYFEGLVSRSKINILMEVDNDGWINQCQWWGGQFARYAADTTAHTTTCVKFKKSSVLGNNAPNGHSFFGCSMEGAFTRTIDYDYNPSIAVTFFSVNRWVACRFEQAAASRFSAVSLYDKLDGCYISPEMVFENGVTPNMDGCTRHFKSNIDVADTVGTSRSTTRTHYFQANNSANAMAISTGIGERINAVITSGGRFCAFNSTDATKLEPTAELSNAGLRFGDGADAPVDRLYRAGATDWRHNFTLQPQTTETYNLGSATYRYNQIHGKQLHLNGGVGFFGTYPITTKPVITGSKTDGTALTSLIAALTSYGLITNSTT